MTRHCGCHGDRRGDGARTMLQTFYKARSTLPCGCCAGPGPRPQDVACKSATERTRSPGGDNSGASRSVRSDPGRIPSTRRAAPTPAAYGNVAAVRAESFTESSPPSGTFRPRLEANPARHRASRGARSTTWILQVARSDAARGRRGWPRRDQTRSTRPKMARGRPGGGAIGVERAHARRPMAARHQIVDVAFSASRAGCGRRLQRRGRAARSVVNQSSARAGQILGPPCLRRIRILHALGSLREPPLGGRRRLVAVAHAGGIRREVVDESSGEGRRSHVGEGCELAPAAQGP